MLTARPRPGGELPPCHWPLHPGGHVPDQPFLDRTDGMDAVASSPGGTTLATGFPDDNYSRGDEEIE